MQSLIIQRTKEVQELLQNPRTFPEKQILNFVSELLVKIASGNKIAFLGNGGSAAEASHIAAEFTGKCVQNHKPVAAMCLNDSVSAITAIGNDYGFEAIFERQVEAHLSEDDILVALSTSGRSSNILRALQSANAKGVKTHLWTGQNQIQIEGTQIWNVPSFSTPRIQEVHLIWGHIIAEIFEIKLNEIENNLNSQSILT
jgi:D-sedoheptulose 7-phosphate isomerase